jgi:hypothetical protein
MVQRTMPDVPYRGVTGTEPAEANIAVHMPVSKAAATVYATETERSTAMFMQLLTREVKAIRSVLMPDVIGHASVRDYIAAVTPVEWPDAPRSLNSDLIIVPLTVLRAAEARITAILTVRPAKRKAAPPARRNPIHMTYMTMMMWKISMKIIMMISTASKMRKIIMMRPGIK